ncbi:MAG TPA: metallophosphoesterase [Armatimonadota bacterium]|nr:metallophosphoesterase [Armatimonadota bacterium]
MVIRFVIAALIFHAWVIPTAYLLGRRWVDRVRKPGPAWLWALRLAADATVLALASGIFAVMASVFARSGGFTTVRFVSQALFGEGVALLAWVAFLHLRAGKGGDGLRARGVALVLATVVLLLVYVEAYHRCPYDLQVRRYSLDVSRGRPGARTLRILHLSDLQTHAIRPYEERVFRVAKEQNADLIVFTGDYIQPRLGTKREPAAAALTALLRRTALSPKLGFYAVGGDAEGGRDSEWMPMLQAGGITPLSDEHVRVPFGDGRALVLIGLSLRMSRWNKPEDVRRLVEAAPAGDVRLVMGHSPDYVRALPGAGRVDLALAGHTHGGQIVLPFLGPPVTLSRLPRKYAGGLNVYQGVPLHVSRGIGMERRAAPQIRFLCPPELSVIDLRY